MERGDFALVWGAPSRPHGTVDAPIGRHPASRAKMAVISRKRREAVTHWRVAETSARKYAPAASLVECMLETGRTHQVRVHLAHIGHPLIGDPLYGRASSRSCANFPSRFTACSPRSIARRCMRRIWLSSIRRPAHYSNLIARYLPHLSGIVEAFKEL